MDKETQIYLFRNTRLFNLKSTGLCTLIWAHTQLNKYNKNYEHPKKEKRDINPERK